MDSVGVHTLGSAAAQGGQDTTYEHANGSPFSRWGSDVQASRDAPHHRIHTAPPIPCVKKHSSRLSVSLARRGHSTVHTVTQHGIHDTAMSSCHRSQTVPTWKRVRSTVISRACDTRRMCRSSLSPMLYQYVYSCSHRVVHAATASTCSPLSCPVRGLVM